MKTKKYPKNYEFIDEAIEPEHKRKNFNKKIYSQEDVNDYLNNEKLKSQVKGEKFFLGLFIIIQASLFAISFVLLGKFIEPLKLGHWGYLFNFFAIAYLVIFLSLLMIISYAFEIYIRPIKEKIIK